MNQSETILSRLLEQDDPRQLVEFGLGLEREALRINDKRHMAQTPHPEKLGSALTHKVITTDFAENLLEFITPVSHSVETLLTQLSDLHSHTYQVLKGSNAEQTELLWPLSMPCYVADETKVPLANYGSSNIGKMKTLYRKGLKLRYGSMMQVIAGVHFNFSFPRAFWEQLYQLKGASGQLTDFISEGYMGVIRQFQRNGWIIPYLFGASPAMCVSFLQRNRSALQFEATGTGTRYLPYATALRLSDLGYTNNGQSQLKICYNSAADYISSLRSAIKLPSAEFEALGLKKDDEYQQLNTNLLQIENELYSLIRPKTVAYDHEKPSEALSRGIEYIEVRALDVNPFSPVGVEAEQLYFIQLLLLDAALGEAPLMNESERARSQRNLNRVVLEGRKPGLMLETEQGEVKMRELASALCERYAPLAARLDRLKGTTHFSDALSAAQKRIADPELTYSGQLMAMLLGRDGDNCAMGWRLANEHAASLANYNPGFWSSEWFEQERIRSIAQQAQIEAADNLSFDAFLEHYFNY